MRLFSDVSSSIADPYLRHAYKLALRGEGATAPNPMVGCVVLKDSRIVGEGWHERAGGPHAEVMALSQAGSETSGSTVYVTLEPCAHHGRTPPCTEALIAAGVDRVVVGMRDPSEVGGGGGVRLSAAGVDVSFSDDHETFEELNRGWLSLVRDGRPWVTAKVASSLDGALAARTGVRTRISGPGSQPVTMRLRAAADAIVVGSSTALIDDPSLTVRSDEGVDAARQPLRVVLARTTDPGTASLFSDDRAPALMLVPRGSTLSSAIGDEVDVLEYPAEGTLEPALSALGARGIARILIEPGRELFTALWNEDLIDELVVIHAGAAVGVGSAGMYAGTGTDETGELRHRMKAVEAAVVGDDAVTVWRRMR